MNSLSPLDRALARLQDGDNHALDEVFDALWPVLVRYARAKTGTASDAEEIAQRVLVRLFESVAHYDRTRPAIGWVLNLAFWECRTENTRSRRQKAKFTSDGGEQLQDTDSPEEQLCLKEHREAFHEAFGTLTPEERQLLLGETSPGDPEISPAAFRKRKQRLFERLTRTIQTILGAEKET